MATKPTKTVKALTVRQQTLEETVPRALKLLRAIGTRKAIRTRMAKVGYTKAVHTLGWQLLIGCSGMSSVEGDDLDENVLEAIHLVDAWDEDGFSVVGMVIDIYAPELHDRILGGLAATTGFGAVAGVRTLLERLTKLESDNKTEKDKKAKETVDTFFKVLGERGVNAAKRVELAKWVATASAMEPVLPATEEEEAAEEKARQDALVALRRWYVEWSTMAKTAVKRRDHLILMGLAQRKVAGDEGDDGEGGKSDGGKSDGGKSDGGKGE